MHTGLLAVTVFLLSRARTQVSAWPQHIHPVGISIEELEELLTAEANDPATLPPSESPSPPINETTPDQDDASIDLLLGGIGESDSRAPLPPESPGTHVILPGFSSDNSFPVTSEPPPLSTGCTCVEAWQCPETNIELEEDTKHETADQPLPDSEGLVSFVDLRHAAPCPGLMVCCDAPDPSISPPSPPLHTPRCGTPNPNGVMTHFLGFKDNQAQFGQFPWMAAIRTLKPGADDPVYGYIGGGSLIQPGIVITAAHNLRNRNPEDLVVRLGEWDFSSTTETIEYQEIPLERVEYHPQYSYEDLKYDVALLFLGTEAVLGATVDTICLPDHEHDFDGSACVTSGWGKDMFGEGGKYQEILKVVNLPAISYGQCEAALRTTRLGPTFSLDETSMCAGGEGGDLCTGDGGSPLVCPSIDDPSRYVQVGIASWGIGCGQHGIPGVYASVTAAMPWIRTFLEVGVDFDIRNVFI